MGVGILSSLTVLSKPRGIAPHLMKIVAVVVTLFLVIASRPQSAEAQYYNYSGYYYRSHGVYEGRPYTRKRARYRKARRYNSRRHKARRSHTRRSHKQVSKRRYKKKQAIVAKPWPKNNDPVQIIVSLPDQRVSLFKGGEKVASTRVSTGKAGHRTPSGIFSIIQKNRRHFSNLYNNAPMPYMQRITWSGLALHAGAIPNYPASHGCIRLPRGFARKLFSYTKMGAHVVVARGQLSPRDITHANLLQPQPATDELGPRISSDERARSDSGIGVGAENTPLISNVTEEHVRLTNAAARNDGIEGISSSPAADTKDLTKLASLDEGALVQPEAREISALRKMLVEKMRMRRWPFDVQRMLKNLRLYSGDVDGDTGPATRRAIRRFQSGVGLRVTGKINRELIEELYRISGKVLDLGYENVKLPRSSEPLRILITRKKNREKSKIAQQLLTDLGYDTGGIDGQLGRMSIAAIRDFQTDRNLPVTGELSAGLLNALYKASGKRKPGEWHLYVRQDFKDLFDVAIDVRGGDAPMGTHLFTAMHFDKGATRTRWTSLTMRSRAGKDRKNCKWNRKKHRRICKTIRAPYSPTISASQALDRIVIAPDVRKILSELLTPGSSLAVTDNGLSHETGEGTDFIVINR